jgi:transcriptional regulator with XRE-family HTH domain
LGQGRRDDAQGELRRQAAAVGERLTRAMAKAHMDRRELAALTGYSEAQIVGWERGRAPLYPTELIKLCHALDVMPEWLLCWERRLR